MRGEADKDKGKLPSPVTKPMVGRMGRQTTASAAVAGPARTASAAEKIQAGPSRVQDLPDTADGLDEVSGPDERRLTIDLAKANRTQKNLIDQGPDTAAAVFRAAPAATTDAAAITATVRRAANAVGCAADAAVGCAADAAVGCVADAAVRC